MNNYSNDSELRLRIIELEKQNNLLKSQLKEANAFLQLYEIEKQIKTSINLKSKL